MKLMKLFALLTLSFILIMPTLAQSKKTSGGIGFYQPGVQFFAPQGLNDYFPDSYPEMKFGLMSHSGGGYAIRKNFIYGGEWGSYKGGPFIQDDIQVDLEAETGGVKLGYVVYAKQKLMVFPMVGFIWNDLYFYIHEPDQNEAYTTVTNHPKQATTLKHSSTNLDLSLSATYMIKGEMSENGGGGLMLGLQAGYQLNGFTSKWTYDNGVLDGGPAFNLDGFYVRLIFGGGGLSFN